MNDREQWVDVFDILWEIISTILSRNALLRSGSAFPGISRLISVNLTMVRMVRFRIEDMACGDSGSRVASGECSLFAVTLQFPLLGPSIGASVLKDEDPSHMDYLCYILLGRIDDKVNYHAF